MRRTAEEAKNNTYLLYSPRRKAFFIAAVLFLLLILPIALYADNTYMDHLDAEEHKEVQKHVGSMSLYFSARVNGGVTLLEGLYALVALDTSPESLERSFEPFVSDLYVAHGGIRNFIVAVGGVNTYVYPVEGNEESLWHDILNDRRPEVAEDIQEMLATREMTVGAPYELRQGGSGIVVRKPVYVDGAFWGLVSMAIDLGCILPTIDSMAYDRGVSIALSSHKGVFYGSDEVVGSGPESVTMTIGGNVWSCMAIPDGGWASHTRDACMAFRIPLILSLLFLGIVIYMVLLHHFNLRSSVHVAEEQLEKKAGELEEEVYNRIQLQSALNEALVHLNTRNKELELVIRSLYHELKGPLVTIGSYSEEITETQSLEGIATIQKAAAELDNKITKLAHYLRGGFVPLPKRINLHTFIDDYLHQWDDDLAALNATISVHYCADSVVSDPVLILTALDTLISNALANTKVDTTLQITIECAFSTDFLIIRVSDNAMGIPAEYRESIFEPYVQLKKSSKSGMGLPLARRMLEEAGGALELVSSSGEGSTFEARIPLLHDAIGPEGVPEREHRV